MSSNQSTIIESDHEKKDRELFNRIAKNYLLKDILPANCVARKCRVEQTLKAISITRKISLLEVGCGAGFAAEYIRGQYNEYCGLDYSEELIRYAKVYHRGEKIEFVNANLKDFKTDRQFDVILLIGVLHHLKDSLTMMQYMVDLLKPGGWAVANEPQAGNPMIRLARAIRKLTDPQYSSDQQEFKIAQLRKIFECSGLKKIRIVPQGLLSTPFAEVKMPFQNFVKLISTLACLIDKKVEKNFRTLISHITWNVIIGGQKTE